MIEFLAGVFVGAIATVVGWITRDDRAELLEENRRMREVLRYVRLQLVVDRHPFAVKAIDQVLADEAGA